MFYKILIICSLASLSACSTFREVHFFSDNTPGVHNYYRLRVSGFSLLSSSRYLSGYFDPEAVSQYFNEIKQPEAGNLNVKNLYTHAYASQDSAQKGSVLYKPLPDQFRNKRLVMVFSSNSNSVSNQIGAIAENQLTVDALAYLLYEDRFKEGREAKMQNTIEKSKREVIIKMGDVLIDSLDENSSGSQVKNAFIQYANILAAELGNTVPFKDLNEAEQWLNANRSAIANRKHN